MKFELELPPTINSSYGTSANRGYSYMYKNAKAKRWQRDAHLAIYAQAGHIKTLTKDNVMVTCELWVVYNRDIDSSFKLLLDTLEYANIINNDKQVIKLSAEKFYGKRNPDKIKKLIVYVDTTKS